MDDDMTDSIDDLLSQLQLPNGIAIARDTTNDPNFTLEKADLEAFLLQHTGRLIKGSIEYIDEVRTSYLTSPDARDVESVSKLIGAAAAAIETLNKIHIANQRNASAKELKIMDIESKHSLLQQDTANKVLLTREELIKKLIDDSKIIEADVILG